MQAGTAPLARYACLASGDLDEVLAHTARVFCDHRLRVAGPGQRLDTRLYYRPLRGIGLGRLSYGATVDIDPGCLERFYLLQWPLRGGETIHAGGREVQSTARLATLISPTAPFRMQHAAGAEKLFVRIERSTLEQLARRLAPDARPGAPEFAPTLPLAERELASLRALLAWLFREASGGTLLAQPLLAAQVEETLLLALLQTLPHDRPELLGTPAPIAPGFVRRAEELMAAQAHEPLTVSTIAAQVGVSARSLYAGFQRYRGHPPMKHLRALRLDKVRAELSRPEAQAASVTEAALRWGFGHLGQFAADYRERFGERPSETLRRARGR